MYLVLSPQENKHQHRIIYNRANSDVRCQQREEGPAVPLKKDAETIKKHQFGKIKVRQVGPSLSGVFHPHPQNIRYIQ